MNSSISIVMRNIKDLVPYENNPRNNDNAVDAVAESIREFGFKNPVIIDKDGVIVAGHTRYKAAKKLGMTELPCVSADDLSEEQIRAFRIADNKTAELADWNEDLLGKELQEIMTIDMSRFGFTEEEEELGDDLPDGMYTTNIKIPQYEITGECPTISDMLETDKADELIEKIKQSNVTQEEKDFLIQAAGRHNVFNYRNIAEYYAHAEPEMQRLMEESALVIIDVGDAIANGYASLTQDVLEIMGGGKDDA